MIRGESDLGGPYTSGSADVGTAVIYALVFAALLLYSYYNGPSRHSVDYWLGWNNGSTGGTASPRSSPATVASAVRVSLTLAGAQLLSMALAALSLDPPVVVA